jgi:ribosomal protein S18 acetylase RimI-like enzyme
MSPSPIAFAKIRKLERSDADQVFVVLELARAASKIPIGPRWTFQQVEDECRQFGLVAERQHEIQSFILWRDTGAAWEISFLATAPDAQGQGLMTSLFEHLKRDKPENRQIWLEVHAGNQGARALYTKAGFVQTGERPNYYADGGTAVLYNYG